MQISPENRSLIKRLLVFLIILAIIDQAVLWVGNRIVNSANWPERLMQTMISPERHDDTLIIGTCRAALHIDTKILNHELGANYFNAGRVVDGLGNMDLTLRIALDHKTYQSVVIVLDDSAWIQTPTEMSDDFERRRLEFGKLKKQSLQDLKATYHLSLLNQLSGFWKYKGMGEELIRAVLKRRSNEPVRDGYTPRNANQNILPSLQDGEALESVKKATYQKLEYNRFAADRIEALIVTLLHQKIRPILVTSPMHRFRASDSVVAEQVQLTRDLAAKYNVPLLNYLDNSGIFATQDSWWSDVGHMNQTGAEAFSKKLAEDLKHIEKRGQP